MFPLVTSTTFVNVHQMALSYNTLSTEEEKQLITAAQSGCNNSLKEVVLSHLRIVTGQVLDLKRHWDDCPDMFQEGSIALLRSIQKYDVSMDNRFSTFAHASIRGAIMEWVNTKRGQFNMWTRKPLLKLLQNSAKYNLDCPVDQVRALAELNVSESDLSEYMERRQSKLETEVRTGEDQGMSVPIYDTLVAGNDEHYITDTRMQQLNKYLPNLTERQRAVISLRFFGDRNRAQVGRELGISQQRVEQIEKQAIENIQGMMNL
ncbi:putative RNA polymerase sigma-70 like domain protein [Vibrio phage 150E35-1]|nr:putative RNA polymerase sigma-70 like domain protein [Vibrio phage 150E35-1]